MRKWVPYIISGALLLISIFIINIQVSSLTTAVDNQNTRVSDLKNQITVQEASNEAKQNEIVSSSTGLDAARKVQDDKIASSFMDKCLTWSTYKEYTDIRNSLIKDYHLSKDSNFLKVFMPEVVNTKSDDGTDYNRIDVFGYNLSYDEMESYVTNISEDGDKYSYFTFVTVTSQSRNNYEGSAVGAFIYTIDGDGNITDIDASVISGAA